MARASLKLRTNAECEAMVAGHKDTVIAEHSVRNTRIAGIWERRKNAWGATVPEGGRQPDIPGIFKLTTKRFKAPFVGDMIRRSQAIIATKMPQATAIPIPGVLSQEEADKIEEWFNLGFYPRSVEKKDWFGQVTDAMANDGEAIWKVLPQSLTWAVQREKAEPDEDFNRRVSLQKHQTIPISVEHVATNTYYVVDEDEEGISEVWEITRRKARAIADRYGLIQTGAGLRALVGPVRRKDGPDPRAVGAVALGVPGANAPVPAAGITGDCEFIEVWIAPRAKLKGQFFYLVDGQVVRSSAHDLPRVPYFRAPFSTTSSHEPGLDTECIADPMIQLQDKIEDLITAVSNVIWIAGFPTLRLKLVNEELLPPYDKDGQVNIVIKPGGVLEGVPMGYIAEWMPAPSIDANAGPYRELLMNMMDRMSLAPILYAHLETQMSTPVATTLIAIARAIFGPGLASLARAFDEMAAYILYLIEHVFGEPIPVFAGAQEHKKGKWLSLGPDDLKGYYGVRHTLEPIIPMERAQQTMLNENMYQNGMLPKTEVLEQAGYSSPSKLLIARMIEDGVAGGGFQQMMFEQFQRRIMQDARFIPPGTPESVPLGPSGPMPQTQALVPPGLPIPQPAESEQGLAPVG